MTGLQRRRPRFWACGFACVLLVSCSSSSGDKVVDERSFLTIRPVVNTLSPPCPAMNDAKAPTTMLTMMRGGAVVCYEAGAAGLDANDVANATALASATSGLWEVTANLTDDGGSRMGTLARQVGTGGQIVIVVDGAAVGAPRLESTNFVFPVRIVITVNADQAGAERLADRLNHR